MKPFRWSPVVLALMVGLFQATNARSVEPSREQPADGTAAKAPLALRDLDGQMQTPLAAPGRKATVLFFLLPECPISNAYAPEINRIVAEQKQDEVACFLVHADPDVTAETARTHAREYGLKCPVLLDPTHALVRATGATMAPEAVVIGPDGKVRYRGRIDDRDIDYGKRRLQPTVRDLREALAAVLQGKEVGNPVTPVIGCDLPKPRR